MQDSLNWKLEVIWPDARCRVDRSAWWIISDSVSQSVPYVGMELLGQLKWVEKKCHSKGERRLMAKVMKNRHFFWTFPQTIHSTLFFFLSRRKSLGGRLQPAVTFIDILCLLDYMQMKWDQIWFLVHYRTIWTKTTPKKFIFCQHEQKRNNGRFNIIGTACFYKFSVALCIFLVCRCRWPDCLQE